MRTTTWMMVAITTLLAAGCGKKPGSYSTQEATGTMTEAETILVEADKLWAERLDQAKLEAAIAKYEEALAADPKNRHAYTRAARGWYFLADAFTEGDQRIERFQKSIEYGKACLSLNPKFKQLVDAGTKEKEAITQAAVEDVPCIYWTSSALGKWAREQSIMKALKYKGTIVGYMKQVEKLDPTFYHHGPSRYWGAYYAALPSFAGRDLDASFDYFTKSHEASPYYLGTLVLRADYWAVAAQEKQQFFDDLKRVVAADANANPEADITPENTKEQEKARALLDKVDELF